MDFIFKWEGGYSNDPRDPGGETNYGISKRAFPELDIKNLTKKHAHHIYKTKYYIPIWGDQLPEELRLVVFSSAINQGVSRAVKFLQKVVGTKQDGKIGPVTMAALKNHDAMEVKRIFVTLQAEHYFSLNKPEFIKGWILRVIDLAVR